MPEAKEQDMESELLVELIQHLKLLEQLIDQTEHFKSLVPKLLSSIQKAISMVRDTLLMADSGVTNTGESPRSETSGLTFKDRERPMPKKRKAPQNFTSQVKVGSMEGYDGPMDDGYSWRKYGQKKIYGAKYPRGYYRCTHRNTHGCSAIKQVQRSDENPSVFDVTYRGNHTCNQKPQQESSGEPERKQSLGQFQQKEKEKQKQHVLDFGTDLGVKTEGQGTECNNKEGVASESISFPSTPFISLKQDSSVFSSPPVNCFTGSFSSDFIWPITSESNYSLPSLFETNINGEMPSLDVGNFDFTEFLPVASATNSSMTDMDFMLGPIKQGLSSFSPEDFWM